MGKRDRKSPLFINVLTTHFEYKLRKVTDYNQVPLGSNYFGAKHRLDFSKSAKPIPVTIADTSAGPSGAAPSSWDGHPYYPPLPNPQHYGHPWHPTPYQFYGTPYASGFPPLNAPAFLPNVTSTTTGVHSEQVQLDQGNKAVVPEQLTPTLSVVQAAVKAFCDKYEFGDEEREGLRKLGFRMGDALDTVTEIEWAVSGLAPLHRCRVLSAWNTEKSLAL